MPTLTFTDNTSGDVSGNVISRLRGAAANATTHYDDLVDVNRYIFVGNPPTDSVTNTLIKFGGIAANIAPGSTVTSVTLRQYFDTNDVADAAYRIGLYKLIQSSNYALSTATSYDGTNPWDDFLAVGATDIDATALAQELIPTTAAAWWEWTGAGLTQYVQDIVDGATDHGINMLRDDGGENDLAYRAGPGPGGSDGFRPELVVVYTAAGSTAHIPTRSNLIHCSKLTSRVA